MKAASLDGQRTRDMRTVRVALALTLLLASSIARSARADAIWAIAGKEVLRLHATVGGLTPEKRVEMLDARVIEILSKGDGTLSAADIAIKEVGKAIAIAVRGDILVTATRDDAAAQMVSREKLARAWLTAIRNTLPQLAPRVNKSGA
jgi:hypothetical protein